MADAATLDHHTQTAESLGARILNGARRYLVCQADSDEAGQAWAELCAMAARAAAAERLANAAAAHSDSGDGHAGLGAALAAWRAIGGVGA